jgi:hypothetical protein
VALLLAALRERLSAGGRRKVLHVDGSQRALSDRPDVEAVAAGRGTPDHVLRIGVRSIVARSAADVDTAVDAFERDYRAYFERHRERLPAGFAMLEPLPRAVLVPGLGMVTAAANPSTAQVIAEIAYRSHLVTARALDAFGRTAWLSEADVFDFDYWPMELYKLSLAPPPPELAALVVIASPALPAPVGEALTARGAVLAAHEAAAERLGGADVRLVPNGSSLAIERPGRQAVVVDGGDPSAVGEAVAFALAGRAPLRDGAHLALR